MLTDLNKVYNASCKKDLIKPFLLKVKLPFKMIYYKEKPFWI